jgi:hypothetical protein
LLGLATRLAEKCKEFNVTGQIKHICPGPVVTTYEFNPDPGVKYSRVVSLVDDLCLALKAESIRIDRMPGKPHVGRSVAGTMSGPNGYDFTVLAALGIVEHLLANEVEGGYYTPSLLMGPDYAASLPGVSMSIDV